MNDHTTYYFDDLTVGSSIDLGSKTVSAEEILRFAREFDPQPFHIDPEAAQHSIFGGLIASGWHTCSIAMRLLVDGLAQCPGLRLSAPAGAFYAFPECSQLLGRTTPQGQVLSNDVELSAYLLEHAGVAVVPGLAFGLPGYFRLSFATSREQIKKAVVRINEALAALR